jgi:hypothetical protein
MNAMRLMLVHLSPLRLLKELLKAYPKNLRHGMPLWAETHVHVGFPMPTDARPRRLPYADSVSGAETHVHVGFPGAWVVVWSSPARSWIKPLKRDLLGAAAAADLGG